MTDNQDPNPNPRRWIDEAEDALNRTSEALKAAWEETRDARKATLEAAREAVNRLSRAIDQGIETAKQSWGASDSETPTPEQTQEEE
ncbi:MAG TPA: hypothetical protein VE569_05600 [Acidimicrobiia bacterium]|nr:hypothetical protein [Acidimicrobiia bacterium]